jgi:hypothetical protein
VPRGGEAWGARGGASAAFGWHGMVGSGAHGRLATGVKIGEGGG